MKSSYSFKITYIIYFKFKNVIKDYQPAFKQTRMKLVYLFYLKYNIYDDIIVTISQYTTYWLLWEEVAFSFS